MLNYVIRRLLIMVPTLFVISLLVYVIIDLPPGDCVTSQIDELLSRGDPDALLAPGARVNLDVACPAEVYFGRIRFPALAMTDVAERIAGLVREFEPPLV